MYDEYKQQVDFLTVYIEEAHAVDEWPIGSRLAYKQPKTTTARRQVARDCIADLQYRIPVLLDAPPENLFGQCYAPWPVRFYLIDARGRMAFIAEPDQCGSYSLAPLTDALLKLLPST
jgi:hypothetical protein